MTYTKRTYMSNAQHPAWFDVRPLRNDSSTSRFTPRSLISTIAKEMMVERWNISIVYERFYESCAPSYCVYTKTGRKKAINVLTALVSLIGGLTLLLSMLIPRLVNNILPALLRIGEKRAAQRRTGRCECRPRLLRHFFVSVSIVSGFSLD